MHLSIGQRLPKLLPQFICRYCKEALFDNWLSHVQRVFVWTPEIGRCFLCDQVTNTQFREVKK